MAILGGGGPKSSSPSSSLYGASRTIRQPPQTVISPAGAAFIAVPPTIVTLNPSDKNSQITLSGGNLTATLPSAITGGPTEIGVRATSGRLGASTDYGFEVTFGTIVTDQFYGSGVGLATSAQDLSVYVGAFTGSAYYCTGFWEGQDGSTGTAATWGAGDVITVVQTATAHKFYKNGVLQITVSSVDMTGDFGPYFPIIDLAQATDSGTANFGASAMSYLPTGTKSWDESQSGTATPNLAAGSGAFALTGNSAGLNVGLPAGSGSFALTGYSATLKVGMPAGSGAFSLTGYAAGDAVGEPAGSGSFALTGRAAGMGINMPAGSGAFNLTGFSAGEAIGDPAGSGSFVLTGRPAANAVGMPAGSGSFALTGHDAAMVASGISPNLDALSGSFVITGRAAAFNVAYPAGSGSFALTGHDASMVSGQGGMLTLAGDPISETAIVAASVQMFRRKYPLSAQPKNTARSLSVPFDALIRREEPGFARERRQQPEYDFTNRIFEVDPSNRGAYEAP